MSLHNQLKNISAQMLIFENVSLETVHQQRTSHNYWSHRSDVQTVMLQLTRDLLQLGWRGSRPRCHVQQSWVSGDVNCKTSPSICRMPCDQWPETCSENLPKIHSSNTRKGRLLPVQDQVTATAGALSLRHLLQRDSGATSDATLTTHGDVWPDRSSRITPKGTWPVL